MKQRLASLPRCRLLALLFGGSDSKVEFRWAVAYELNKNIAKHSPNQVAELALELLDEEVKYAAKADCFYPHMQLATLLVYKLGRPEDALRIWRAKTASFDMEACLDVEFFFGAGQIETLQYLRKLAEGGNAEAELVLNALQDVPAKTESETRTWLRAMNERVQRECLPSVDEARR